jgi:hypothetical protein
MKMARLRNLWAWATVTVASLGVGISLLLGGALGTAAATGASPSATPTVLGAPASSIFGCRASLARVSLGGTTLVEPSVANSAANDTTNCADDSAAVANPVELGNTTTNLGSVGPASVETYEYGELGGTSGPGAISETTVSAVNLSIGGYTLSVAGPLDSLAAAACNGTTLQTFASAGSEYGNADSELLTVTSPGGSTMSIPLGSTVNQLVGSLPAALSALISITANEQTITATSTTERLFDIKVLGASGAQVVIGEATVNYPNPDVCAGNVPTTTTVTNTTTTPGTTTTVPGTTVTQPGSVTTITGTNGTATTVTTPSTTIIEPSGSTPPSYLQECADGSILDPVSGNCVIVYDGQTIYVSKPFKGPVGGMVYSLGQAKTLFHSTCLSGAGPDYVFVVSKSDISAKGTPLSDRILITGSSDHLAGLAGNDCIDGQGPNQKITDANGRDRIYYHKGYNKIVAGNGPNLVRGEGATSAYIIDGTGSDYIYAGSLRTVIQAYGNEKHIYGGAANDRIWTNSQVAKISCGGGKANVVFARKQAAAYAKKHGCQKIGLLR